MKYKVGQKLIWLVRDFDGSFDIPCVVSAIFEDHCIAYTDDDRHLWIDTDTEEDFIDYEVYKKMKQHDRM